MDNKLKILSDLNKFKLNDKLAEFIRQFEYSTVDQPNKGKKIKIAMRCFLLKHYNISIKQDEEKKA